MKERFDLNKPNVTIEGKFKSYARTATLSAIQWDGKLETFNLIRELIKNAKYCYVNCLRVDVGNVIYVAELGDYVVVSNPVRVIKLDEFKNEYKEDTVSIP